MEFNSLQNNQHFLNKIQFINSYKFSYPLNGMIVYIKKMNEYNEFRSNQ